MHEFHSRQEGGWMLAKTTSAIRLEDAYFCLSCEVVTNSSGTCLVCGHTQLWPLENWIGRVSNENSRFRAGYSQAASGGDDASNVPKIRLPKRQNPWTHFPAEECAGGQNPAVTCGGRK